MSEADIPDIRIRGFHPLGRAFPDTSPYSVYALGAFRQPLKHACNPGYATRRAYTYLGLGFSPFARHYFGNLN